MSSMCKALSLAIVHWVRMRDYLLVLARVVVVHSLGCITLRTNDKRVLTVLGLPITSSTWLVLWLVFVRTFQKLESITNLRSVEAIRFLASYDWITLTSWALITWIIAARWCIEHSLFILIGLDTSRLACVSFWYISRSLILIPLMQFLLTLTKSCSVITVRVRIRRRLLVGFWKERRSCPLACLTSMFQGYYLTSFVRRGYKSRWSELASSIVDKSCWWWGSSIELIA